MTFRNFTDEFNSSQNKKALDAFHAYVADILTHNKIPLDNVFFVSSPGFVAFISEFDKSIIHRPASDYSNFITRKVIFEKCKQSKKFDCYFYRQTVAGDKIISKTLSVMSYQLDWNKSVYGENYDLMTSLKKFIKSKSHLPIFMYVDTNFFQTIQETKIIRVAILDNTVI
jgi:hypothetical protein